jgi:hypothetical protein
VRRFLPLLVLVSAISPLRPIVGQISLERVNDPASRFVKPVFATSAPGEPTTLYVVGREGVISRLDTTTVGATPEPFMTLNNTDFPGSDLNIISDTGFLGLAFHPNYESNGKFYTYYSATAGSAEFRVDQFLAVNGVVQTGVRKNVITVPTGPATNFKHAGGWIGFDPTGGTTLHVAVGDGRYVTTLEGGDPENNAQDTSKLLGKLLRIDVGVDGLDFNDPESSYTIPSGNMVVNPNSGLTSPAPPSSVVLPEIYAYGLRNPWRGSFDRATGDLYIGDVGQRTREEINFIPAGRINTAELDETPGSLNGINFGWRLREGSIATFVWKIMPVPEPYLAITELAVLAIAALRGVRQWLASRR